MQAEDISDTAVLEFLAGLPQRIDLEAFEADFLESSAALAERLGGRPIPTEGGRHDAWKSQTERKLRDVLERWARLLGGDASRVIVELDTSRLLSGHVTLNYYENRRDRRTGKRVPILESRRIFELLSGHDPLLHARDPERCESLQDLDPTDAPTPNGPRRED